jgi:glycosyltransferase involved in cell wall biosynthesis
MDDKRKHYLYVYKDIKKYLLSQMISKPIETYVLRKATKVYGAYKFAANYAQRHGAPQVEVIYNRVPIQRYIPLRKKSLNNPPLLIYVGNFIPGKNQETLIKMMEYVDAKLLLIGGGLEREKCQFLVKSMGLDNRVNFIESIPNIKLHEYYQTADIYISAATYGGIAIPSLEAMACGLPCVIAESGFSGPPELVEGIALMPKNDAQEIARAVNMILINPSVRKSMAEAGRNLMESLSGEIMEIREKNIYQSVLRRN